MCLIPPKTPPIHPTSIIHPTTGQTAQLVYAMLCVTSFPSPQKQGEAFDMTKVKDPDPDPTRKQVPKKQKRIEGKEKKAYIKGKKNSGVSQRIVFTHQKRAAEGNEAKTK